jgi:hypothetical protein
MLREVFVQGTADDIWWQSLSRSLEQVSTMTNGAEQAIPGLEVFYCNLGVMGSAHSLIFGLVIVYLSVHLRNTSSVSCSHMTVLQESYQCPNFIQMNRRSSDLPNIHTNKLACLFVCNFLQVAAVINHASTPGPGAIETCLKFSDHDLNESVTSLKQNVATDANVDDAFLVSDTPMTFQNLSKSTPQMPETPACMVDSISTPEHPVVYNETSKTSYHINGISSQPERLAFSVKENSTVDFPATSLMFEVHTFNPILRTWLLGNGHS